MDELRTTPHDFIWRVKNPQDYWTNRKSFFINSEEKM